MNRERWLGALALSLLVLVIFVYFPWGPERLGAPKYPVTGTVLVNGEPAAGLMLRFYSKNEELMMQDRTPVASTDKQGRFQMSSFGGFDGAAEGEFAVIFYWPTNLLNPVKDRFQGRFSNVFNSQYHVLIPPEPIELPPFKLEIDPKDMLPLELGYKHLELMHGKSH